MDAKKILAGMIPVVVGVAVWQLFLSGPVTKALNK